MIPAFQMPRPLHGGRAYHPLIGAWDLDPQRWRPIQFGGTIELSRYVDMQEPFPLLSARERTLKITTSAQNVLLTRMTHGVIYNDDQYASQPLPSPDAQYTIDFADDRNIYTAQPIQAALGFGQAQSGGGQFVLDFPWPIWCPGSKTFRFLIRNFQERVSRESFPPLINWTLGIVLHGMVDCESEVENAA